jgi:hypothetical protein
MLCSQGLRILKSIKTTRHSPDYVHAQPSTLTILCNVIKNSVSEAHKSLFLHNDNFRFNCKSKSNRRLKEVEATNGQQQTKNDYNEQSCNTHLLN